MIIEEDNQKRKKQEIQNFSRLDIVSTRVTKID